MEPSQWIRRGSWLLAPVLLLALVALVGMRNPTYYMGDFRAFYCAGSTIAHGANPYLQEPLRTCENHAGPPAEPLVMRPFALPAPLLPHVLLLYVPLSRLPFPIAGLCYTALLMFAMMGSTALLARVIGAPSALLNLVLAGITSTFSYFLGQPMPFVFLALAGAALCVRRERWTAAAACAIGATIEPHLALPVIFAMGAFLPRTRVPLVAFGAAALGLGVLAVGPATTLMYVRDVLPAHALANAYEWQFSLTSVLTSAGVAAPAAVRLGELMFAAMTAIGVLAAGRLRRITGDAAVLVLVPPAFAVFGGVHVHLQQLAIAFPAVLYIVVRYPHVRTLAASGLAFAMIPWEAMSLTVLAGAAPFLTGAFGAAVLDRRRGLIFAAVTAGIVLCALALAAAGLGPPAAHIVAHHYPAGGLAETSWGDLSRAALMRPCPLMQWLRVPTLAGLACALVALAQIAFAHEAEDAQPAPALLHAGAIA